MIKIARLLIVLIGFTTVFAGNISAKTVFPFTILDGMAKSRKIPLDSAAVAVAAVDEKVIVGSDTVSIILPQKNYGRYDRGLLNYLYIPKGQWSFGMTASYGEFSTDDVQILSILKDFDIKIISSPTINLLASISTIPALWPTLEVLHSTSATI